MGSSPFEFWKNESNRGRAFLDLLEMFSSFLRKFQASTGFFSDNASCPQKVDFLRRFYAESTEYWESSHVNTISTTKI